MKTIFAAHRKRLRCIVYISAFDRGDGIEYQRSYSRERREEWDRGSSQPRWWDWKHNRQVRYLYRINVYPKECPT
jgi:hypothetical protein